MRASTPEEFETFLSARAFVGPKRLLADGALVDGWRVTALLGRGGNGEVYRVERAEATPGRGRSPSAPSRTDEPFGRGRSPSAPFAALKILSHDSDTARVRFAREIELLSQNRYSAFPQYFSSGEVCPSSGDGRHPYYVMELLEPVELPQDDRAVASYLLALARAVGALHTAGLVHRDIKSQNVMRRTNGELVLIDLGLVRPVSGLSGASGLTVTVEDGRAVGAGTPRYAAPEQFNGGAVSFATDIHALGMLANECFAGYPPRVWERIISRSTSSIPERRYGDIEAFASAIRHRNRPRILAGGAISCVILGGLTVGFVLGYEPDWSRHIELNGQVRVVTDSLVLKGGHEYEIVGPGTLDADISGPTNATVRLKNCVLLNRSRQTYPKNGINYILEDGAYLNFINIPREPLGLRKRDFIVSYDGAHSEVRFGGPDTIGDLMQQKNFEWDQSRQDK